MDPISKLGRLFSPHEQVLDVNSSATNAVVSVMEYMDNLRVGTPVHHYSRLFLYFATRSTLTTDYLETEGILPVNAAIAAMKYGTPEEKLWPHYRHTHDKIPERWIFEEAAKNRLLRWELLDPPNATFKKVDKALYYLSRAQPVIFSIALFKGFVDDLIESNNVLPMPQTGEIELYATLILVGYDMVSQVFNARLTFAADWCTGDLVIPFSYYEEYVRQAIILVDKVESKYQDRENEFDALRKTWARLQVLKDFPNTSSKS